MISLITLTLYSLWFGADSAWRHCCTDAAAGLRSGAWLVWRFYRWLVWWHPQLLMPFYHIGETRRRGDEGQSAQHLSLRHPGSMAPS
jgi:hypothetical protein